MTTDASFLRHVYETEGAELEVGGQYLGSNTPPGLAFYFRRRFERALGILPRELAGKHFLDIGSGSGVYTKYLLESGATGVSLDVSQNYLDKLSTLCSTHGLTAKTVQGTADNLPFKNGQFDLVLCLEVLEHVPDCQRSLDEAVRVLAPGDHLILSFPSKYSLKETRDRIRVRRTQLKRFTKNVARWLLGKRLDSRQEPFLQHLHFFGLRTLRHMVASRQLHIEAIDYSCFTFPLFQAQLGNSQRFACSLSAIDTALARTPLRFLAWNVVLRCVKR